MYYLCHSCAVCSVILYWTMLLWNVGVLCNIGCPSQTHLKPKSCEISLVSTFNQSFNHFEILHRAWQWYCHALLKISKWWDKLMWMLRMNDNLWDLSLRWVSDEYPVLYSTPRLPWWTLVHWVCQACLLTWWYHDMEMLSALSVVPLTKKNKNAELWCFIVFSLRRKLSKQSSCQWC